VKLICQEVELYAAPADVVDACLHDDLGHPRDWRQTKDIYLEWLGFEFGSTGYETYRRHLRELLGAVRTSGKLTFRGV
jgi:hypothetical protein